VPLPDQLFLLCKTVNGAHVAQEEMTTTHRLRISKDADIFSPVSADIFSPVKCWVTKCRSNGDLSAILGRLKRTNSTRQLCLYLLTHVRGNNNIQHKFPPRLFLHQRLVGLHLLIQPRTVSKRRKMFRTYEETKEGRVSSEDLWLSFYLSQ